MDRKIKFIKKVKANFIRFRLHKIFGIGNTLRMYLGQLVNLSKWVEDNKGTLKYNDFYNKKVKHGDRMQLYTHIVEDYQLATADMSYLEFGVAHGFALRWWVEANTSKNSDYWAYDTYNGLPEDYGSYKVGTFSRNGEFPDIDDERINFVKGLFQDTLIPTLRDIDFSKKVVIHLDGDLYSSALYPLSILYPHLKVGDLIIFDEFGVPLHEFRAFDDFCKTFYIKLKPIGAINNYLQMVFEIEEIKNHSSFK